jgi:hypothetical protein
MLISQGQYHAKADTRPAASHRDAGPARWSLPLARWAAWSAASDGAPDLKFIDLMLRRRLSALSKMAMKVAHDCAGDRPAVRVVFASRHGELNRTTTILDDIVAQQPVSPTAFSLAVLNAMPGVMSIARQDRSTSAALSAGAQTLGYALLEAYTQYQESPEIPVLLVYAHEPAGERYGPVDDDPERGALALLIEAGGAHELICELDTQYEDGGLPAAAGAGDETRGETHNETDSGAHNETRGGTDSRVVCARRFPTQSGAVLHTLSTLSTTTWQAPRTRWSWDCHVRAH